MSTKLQYTVYQEAPDLWVARSLNLATEISSDGATESEALDNLREALNLHFENYVFPSTPGIPDSDAEIPDDES